MFVSNRSTPCPTWQMLLAVWIFVLKLFLLMDWFINPQPKCVRNSLIQPSNLHSVGLNKLHQLSEMIQHSQDASEIEGYWGHVCVSLCQRFLKNASMSIQQSLISSNRQQWKKPHGDIRWHALHHYHYSQSANTGRGNWRGHFVCRSGKSPRRKYLGELENVLGDVFLEEQIQRIETKNRNKSEVLAKANCM